MSMKSILIPATSIDCITLYNAARFMGMHVVTAIKIKLALIHQQQTLCKSESQPKLPKIINLL